MRWFQLSPRRDGPSPWWRRTRAPALKEQAMSLISSVRRPVVLLAIAAATTAAIVAGTAVANAADTGATSGLEQRNLATIKRVYTEVYGQGKTDRVSQFFAKDVIQHDATIADGQAGVVASVKAQQAATPRPVITIKHVLAEGSLVAVHSQVSTTPDNEKSGQATAELYRLVNNKIVEHWALTQNVTTTPANTNSMFSDLYQYAGTAPATTKAQENTNKQLVLRAVDDMFMVRDLGVLDRYWAPGNTYLQHNPNIPNGTAGLKGFVAAMAPTVHQTRFTLADGDFVITFKQSMPSASDLTSDNVGSAVVDLYRVVNSTIVEHWDVVTTVPATTVNGHSVLSSLYEER
jgi:predicted SnoaL-like aldol condensation-catalyzing enzyme